MRRLLAIAAAAPVVMAAAAPAQAHAFLARSVPAVGSTIAAAPASVRIDFTAAVEPAFSEIAVLDAAGNRVDDGAPARSGGDAASLVAGLKRLHPGTYLVRWHVVATDTHRTEGSFRFTVTP